MTTRAPMVLKSAIQSSPPICFFATSGSISKITCHGDEDENDAKESQDAPAAMILEISA